MDYAVMFDKGVGFMNKTTGILRFFQSIFRFNFGNFEKEELIPFSKNKIIK